jgi:hypothetical protein
VIAWWFWPTVITLLGLAGVVWVWRSKDDYAEFMALACAGVLMPIFSVMWVVAVILKELS